MRFNALSLMKFVKYCLNNDLNRNRVRKEALDILINAQTTNGAAKLPMREYQSLKGFLSLRNNEVNNDARLAFDVQVAEIAELCSKIVIGDIEKESFPFIRHDFTDDEQANCLREPEQTGEGVGEKETLKTEGKEAKKEVME